MIPGPPEPCPDNTPFTACWCETRPNNPNCKTIGITNNYLGILIIIAIFIFTLRKVIKEKTK